VEALRKAFAAMLRDPDFIKEADARGLTINPVSAEALTQTVNGALNATDAAKKRARKYFQ
jgi:non-canonical (house-cleaning) NTP pyrophosphatase